VFEAVQQVAYQWDRPKVFRAGSEEYRDVAREKSMTAGVIAEKRSEVGHAGIGVSVSRKSRDLSLMASWAKPEGLGDE
jgi:hypothetical protein